MLAARSLALDTPQALALQEEAVVRLEHLSLLRSGQEGEGSPLVEVASTLASLVAVGGAVAVGRPVLLLGGAGVRKTALVRELARRTGRELLTLQVGLEWSWVEVRARSWLCTTDSVPDNVL